MMAPWKALLSILWLSAGCRGEFNMAWIPCKSTPVVETMEYADFLHPGDDVQPVSDDAYTFLLTQAAGSQRGGLLTKVASQAEVSDRMNSGCTEVKAWSYVLSMEVGFEGPEATHADGITISLVDGSRLSDATSNPYAIPHLGDEGGCLACNGDPDVGCVQGATVPGWTAELDTYRNSFPITNTGFDPSAERQDPSDLHLAIAPDCAVDDPSDYLDLEEYGYDWSTLTASWLPLTVELTPTRMSVGLDGLPDLAVDNDFTWPDFLFVTASTGSDGSAQMVRGMTASMTLEFEEPDEDGDTFLDRESGLDALSE